MKRSGAYHWNDSKEIDFLKRTGVKGAKEGVFVLGLAGWVFVWDGWDGSHDLFFLLGRECNAMGYNGIEGTVEPRRDEMR